MSSSTIVTRFAPSPTGFLHVGGARTALFNWLVARHTGGKYFLRIEDTDLARSTRQAVDQLLEDLKWLGLDHDNPELMFQSRRLNVYNGVIDRLIAQGRAYKAYDTNEELDAMRKDAEKNKQAFLYRRRPVSDEQVAQWEREGRGHVVRFAMPQRDYSFDDQILGRIDLPSAQTQDFVIRKADGMPTYHFAVVVDDAEMGITHVIRGQEHTLNTFLHIALQEALAYPRPSYAHLPVILNRDDGKKMGKRDRDRKIRSAVRSWLKSKQQSLAALAAACGLTEQRLQGWLDTETIQLDLGEQKQLMPAIGLRETDLPEVLVHDFRKNGYLPEVLLNFIALVGWSPGGDREKLSIDEMISMFSLEDVNKAGAKFDRDKLLSFNTDASAAAPPQRLLMGLRDFLSCNDSPMSAASDEKLLRVIKICAGFRTFRDLDDKARSLFLADDQIVHQPEAMEKVLRKNNGEGFSVLRDIEPILATVQPWTHDKIDAAIKDFCATRNLGMGKVAQPIRVAVTGTTISPAIGDCLEMLGRVSTQARIQRCLRLG